MQALLAKLLLKVLGIKGAVCSAGKEQSVELLQEGGAMSRCKHTMPLCRL